MGNGILKSIAALLCLASIAVAQVAESVRVNPTTGALVAPAESSFKAANHLMIGADVQAYNAALAAIAAAGGVSFSTLLSHPTTLAGYGITNALTTANNLSDIGNAASARINLGLTIGTNVQAYSSALFAISVNTGTLDISGLTLTLPSNVATKIPFMETGTGAVSTSLDAILRSLPINVKDFGAIGNDSHDDTVAIQAAANAAATQLRPLYLPSGTYKITSTLNVGWEGMEVYGDGEAVSTIKQYTSSQNGITVAYPADGLWSLHDFGVADSTALGNTSTSSTATGVLLDGHLGPNYTNCRLANIAVEGFLVGIEFYQVDITTVTNVFTSSGDTGFYVHGNSNNISFVACPVYPMQNARFGYHLDGTAGGNTCSINGTDLLGQTSDSHAILIRIDGMYGAAVRNVSVENNPGTGFPVELTGGGTCTIDGLILRTNANSYGIHLASSSSSLAIAGAGFAGANAKIRVDKDSPRVPVLNCSPGIYPQVDSYVGGVLMDTYIATPNSLVVDSTPAGFYEGNGTFGSKDNAGFVWSNAQNGSSKFMGIVAGNIAADSISFLSSANQHLETPTEAARINLLNGNSTFAGTVTSSAGALMSLENLVPGGGSPTIQVDADSVWIVHGAHAYGAWNHSGYITSHTSYQLPFSPGTPPFGTQAMMHVTSCTGAGAFLEAICGINAQLFGCNGLAVAGVNGNPYIVATGSVAVADGDTISDAHGASALAVAGTGATISFRWLNGIQWFTAGDIIMKNGTSTGLTASSVGPFTSGLANSLVIYLGHNIGVDGWCVFNGQPADATVAVEYRY